MIFFISDINWDVDNEDSLKDLPDCCNIECDDEDGIADALSDEYGFCVNGFSVEAG